MTVLLSLLLLKMMTYMYKYLFLLSFDLGGGASDNSMNLIKK